MRGRRSAITAKPNTSSTEAGANGGGSYGGRVPASVAAPTDGKTAALTAGAPTVAILPALAGAPKPATSSGWAALSRGSSSWPAVLHKTRPRARGPRFAAAPADMPPPIEFPTSTTPTFSGSP
eukprot:scaffold76001_cov30-Tisochrysis_lutea.AAC.4